MGCLHNPSVVAIDIDYVVVARLRRKNNLLHHSHDNQRANQHKHHIIQRTPGTTNSGQGNSDHTTRQVEGTRVAKTTRAIAFTLRQPSTGK